MVCIFPEGSPRNGPCLWLWKQENLLQSPAGLYTPPPGFADLRPTPAQPETQARRKVRPEMIHRAAVMLALAATLALTSCTGRGRAPGGQRLAVATPGGRIWMVEDPADLQARHLAELDTAPGALTWAPDGSRIVSVTTLPAADPLQRSDVLEVLPATGGKPARWYLAAHGGTDLAGWWADGRGIRFRQLTHDGANGANAFWLSPPWVGRGSE